MIPSINRVLHHGGRDYLIECEDLGEGKDAFEIRVIAGGSLLWQKRVSYPELPEEPGRERGEGLRAAMERTVQTAQAAIVQGRIGA